MKRIWEIRDYYKITPYGLQDPDGNTFYNDVGWKLHLDELGPDYEKVLRSLSNVKQIALACRLYAADNADNFPPSLDILVPDYEVDPGIRARD